MQGLNEIFERYVIQRIYLDAPVLPSISPELFDYDEVGTRIAPFRAFLTFWFVYCVILNFHVLPQIVLGNRGICSQVPRL